MDFSTSDDHSEPVREFLPFLRIYKDGTVQRLTGTKIVPPSLHDPKSAVQSKDVRYYSSSSAGGIYLPKQTTPGEKLPVLVYYHGGAFLIESAFSPIYHNYLNTLVAEANVIAVSVDYRRAPENPLPIAYEDSWAALEWIASHSSGGGSEDWLNKHADFDSVFVAGDSAGAGRYYCEAVRKSGWKGEIELLEAKDEQHVFHLMDGGCENAVAMRSKICSFING
ncbi:unnamed protein product [Linum tenue]|uniref:Alpha/beta hydrolase fold-3 domain-containing protein n=1 Tax=Linum tenue TaxID=586396 RepID=A0AAV0MJZ5_9ROSI|nr:unnamed protein product [Linum tenue]CAI0626372.1 unnamed protein product [Linum tenue]